MEKAIRVAKYIYIYIYIYIYGCRDTHKMMLVPTGLSLISTADASFAEHPDGKSHSGGTVGYLIPVVILHCFIQTTCGWDPGELN
jgi:hypothetical protein